MNCDNNASVLLVLITGLLQQELSGGTPSRKIDLGLSLDQTLDGQTTLEQELADGIALYTQDLQQERRLLPMPPVEGLEITGMGLGEQGMTADPSETSWTSVTLSSVMDWVGPADWGMDDVAWEEIRTSSLARALSGDDQVPGVHGVADHVHGMVDEEREALADEAQGEPGKGKEEVEKAEEGHGVVPQDVLDAAAEVDIAAAEVELAMSAMSAAATAELVAAADAAMAVAEVAAGAADITSATYDTATAEPAVVALGTDTADDGTAGSQLSPAEVPVGAAADEPAAVNDVATAIPATGEESTAAETASQQLGQKESGTEAALAEAEMQDQQQGQSLAAVQEQEGSAEGVQFQRVNGWRVVDDAVKVAGAVGHEDDQVVQQALDDAIAYLRQRLNK